MTGEPKPPDLDTEEIDDAWGADAEPAAPPKPVKPPPVKPPAAALHQSVPVEKSRSPRSRRSSPGVDEEDPIEFEGETVTRDSMPTFQHPNPLIYDVPPDSQEPPQIPGPPPLPKLPKKSPKRR